MADEQRVYQGGAIIVGEPVDKVTRVYQAGAIVLGDPVNKSTRIYQAGVTLVTKIHAEIYVYDVAFE